MEVHLANSPDVTNPFILPLSCSLWAAMEHDPACILEMNKIQIRYALCVAQCATTAYQNILNALDGVTPSGS